MSDSQPETPTPKIIQIIQGILITLLVGLASLSAGIVYLVKFICCR